MEENLKNKLGFWCFFLFVLFLLIGGFFLTNYIINKPNNNDILKNNNDKNIDYRIDKKKDYIYFINEEVISEGAEIYYKDVVINLESQESLTENLAKENEIFKSNIKYISDEENLTEELINFNNDNLYALTFREYKTYEYNNYVSLVINDYNYSCFDLNTFIGTKSYIFDVSKGVLLDTDDILNLYNLNIDSLKEKVKLHLENTQQVVEEAELIKIDDTINNLNYSLYINEYGKLYISFLVKTTKVDYNEIMEV